MIVEIEHNAQSVTIKQRPTRIRRFLQVIFRKLIGEAPVVRVICAPKEKDV